MRTAAFQVTRRVGLPKTYAAIYYLMVNARNETARWLFALATLMASTEETAKLWQRADRPGATTYYVA